MTGHRERERGRRNLAGAGLLAALVLLVAVEGAAAQDPGRVLTLREAVSTSLEENLGLADAEWGLEAAQAQVREAWGSIMPTVNFNASYTRNLELPQFFLPAIFFDSTASPGDVVPVQSGSDNSWFAQARADQPLFNAAAFLGVGAAGRYETLQSEMVRGQAQAVATQTRLRYYDVLLAQEQVRLTTNSVSRVEQVLEETRALNRAGLSSEYDVLRLEVELSNLRPNLARSENALTASRRGLAVSMGVEELGDVELAGSLLTLELPELPELPGGEPVITASAGTAAGGTNHAPALLLDRGIPAEGMPTQEAVQVALRNRSDLRQLALTRDLRETERRVEMSQYLPQISLFGTWSMTAQGNGSPTWFGDNRFSTTAVGVEVSVPLFSGFQRPARLGQLGAVVRQVDAQLELARDQAENEVVTLADQARESYDRVAAQRRAVGQAQRGYEIARTEYREGLGSQLQVTDAELALRESEFNYAQAVYDYLTAQAQLDAAIGVVPLVDEGARVAVNG